MVKTGIFTDNLGLFHSKAKSFCRRHSTQTNWIRKADYIKWARKQRSIVEGKKGSLLKEVLNKKYYPLEMHAMWLKKANPLLLRHWSGVRPKIRLFNALNQHSCLCQPQKAIKGNLINYLAATDGTRGDFDSGKDVVVKIQNNARVVHIIPDKVSPSKCSILR